MNFFKQQDAARQKTGLLVVLLVLAVISLVAVTILCVAFFVYFLQTHSTSVGAVQAQSLSFTQQLWAIAQSEIGLWVLLGVSSVVLAGTLFKYAQLSGGGKRVAESLGGRLIYPDTQDANERKVLNVVEEMAIASGNPVPNVYLIDESGINAFAAGMARNDAVIGVTRGCIELLNRDELQGVIAHEFSHIHNGDMRLNLRLVALLHGILVIGLIGYFLLRGSTGYHVRYSSSNRSKGDGARIGLGVALVAIGYGGVFFGNIIKAAVSRQREFLADSSAVQFTRNPLGIGNALKKIGGFAVGSEIHNKHAAEYSHMYFGQGIRTAFGGLMATHPPIHLRIKRIFPNWNGSYINPEETTEKSAVASEAAQAMVSQFSATQSTQTAKDFTQTTLNSVGAPQPENLVQAQTIIAQIPQTLRDAAHQPFSARALIYALLLDTDAAVCELQLSHLEDKAHPATFKVMRQLYPQVFELPRELHLPLIELSIPSLKLLSATQYPVFKQNLAALIRADKKVNIFEWCVYRIIVHNCEQREIKGTRTLSSLADEVSVLFSLVVNAGKSQSPGGAFQKGIETLSLRKVSFKLSEEFSFKTIDNALLALSELKLLEKPKLLKALAALITADGVITSTEAELFRAVADTLDCPVPPLQVA
ncbi:peptidase M48-like protein [Alteromonadaceae bacterium 2753L.S.0a.02]|nr:peptidase M48-like protein [Alteromonadaceae bacterium 2753L.S.0a.02]